MDRRLAGIVVLILALAAVVVVPSVDGRRVAGTAVATTFPDPPAVGDCLRAPLPASVLSPGPVPEVRVTAADLGPCEGSVSGEVVAFWATPAIAQAAPSSRFGGPCYPQAAEFAGLDVSTPRSTDVPGAPSGGLVRWKPTISFQAVQVVPGEEEQRAGRTWTACLVVPSGEPSYQGTLRNAVTEGMPAGFSLCWNGTDLDRMPEFLPCGQPHEAELVATGWVRDRSTVTIPEVGEACAGIAGRLMGSADPTRGGQLRVVADRMTAQADGRSDGPLTVACFVTSAADQQLSGSVIGLGERDVPFVQ
jgi:hypothetical protein